MPTVPGEQINHVDRGPALLDAVWRRLMIVAIIPACGGSKRIPRKNIRPFAGRPMLAHSIAPARDAGLFDRILVSTDDDEIAQVAKAHGAEVPFRRPAELSDDHATSITVIAHAVEWLAASGQNPWAVCCLYATAPFVRVADLRMGMSTLRQSGAPFCFAGQFYWRRADAWRDGLPIYAPHSRTILMPRHRVQDIDTIEDWRRAELMHIALAQRPEKV